MLIQLLEDRIGFLRAKYIPILIAGFTPDDPQNPPKRPRKRPYLIDKVNLPALGIQPEYAGQEVNALPPDRLANRVFEIIENEDPSPVKIYTEWMLQRFIMGEYLIEDVERLHDACDMHMRMKLHRLLTPEEADINKVPTWVLFLEWMRSKLKKSGNSHYDPAYEKEMEAQSDILLNDSKYTVLVPKTKEAACWFGRDTEWCTAWGSQYGRNPNKSNRWSSYTDGNLYIITLKKTGAIFQFHFKASQFMDVNDRSINMDQFWNANPTLFRRFLVWQGILGGIDWTEIARLPLCQIVIGRVAEELSNNYRVWPLGKEPLKKSDGPLTKEQLDAIPVNHNVFRTNPLAGSSMLYSDISNGTPVLDNIDSGIMTILHAMGPDAIQEFVDWLNSVGLFRWKPRVYGDMAQLKYTSTGEQIGSYNQLKEEVYRSGPVVWTTIPNDKSSTRYYAETDDGHVFGSINKNGYGDGIMWAGELGSPLPDQSLTQLMALNDERTWALQESLPTILALCRDNMGLKASGFSQEWRQFLWFTYKTSARIAHIFNTLELSHGSVNEEYYYYDLVPANDGFKSFDEVSKIYMKADDITVHVVPWGTKGRQFRLYKGGTRYVNEITFGTDVGGLSVWMKEHPLARAGTIGHNDPARATTIWGRVLLSILQPILENNQNVSLGHDIVKLCHSMPTRDFNALREIIGNLPSNPTDDDDEPDEFVSPNIGTIRNLVKHGHLDEAKQMVVHYTEYQWHGDDLAVRKVKNIDELIEDYGNDDAQSAFGTCQEGYSAHWEINLEHEKDNIVSVLRLMDDEDWRKLTAFVATEVGVENEDGEPYDFTDADDVFDLVTEHRIHDVESIFYRIATDYATRSAEKDAHDHLVSALNNSNVMHETKAADGSIKWVSGMMFDTPYLVLLHKDQVFQAVEDMDPEDYDWADALRDELDSEKRIIVDQPSYGWDTSNLDKEEEKGIASEIDLSDIELPG